MLAGRIAAVWGWLVRRPGYMFLTADDQQIAAEPPERFAHAWADLLVLSLVFSLAGVGVWAGAWRLFGEPVGRLMPSVAVAAFFVLWPYRRALGSAIETLWGKDATMRAIAASAWVLALTLGLLSIKQDFRSDASLPKFIAWIRPWEKVYRVPILMPLWGAWAMLVTPQFYRRKSAGDGAVAAFARGCGPLTATAVMGLLLALTITYFNFLPWAQLTISAVTVFAAVAGGTVCCWLDGGLTRRALLAANVITQLVFLLVSLAAWNLLVW